MQYFGGKFRIASDIAGFINKHIDNRDYVEPFCGACNVISMVLTNGKKFAFDINKYLIEMLESVRDGWVPPTKISEEEYRFFKENKEYNPSVTGFVGFACSFAGKWFGGYAKNLRGDNFAKNGSNSLVKQSNSLLDINFKQSDYKELSFYNCFIYCDPPYKGTTKYSGCDFDYEEFVEWVKEQSINNIVIVSEYKCNVPKDAIIVWEKQSKKEIRNKNNNRDSTIEVLWAYNKI